MVAYALLRAGTLRSRADCDTDDCLQHAYMLVAGLNRSLDPCDDFGAFVCSAWFTTSLYSFSKQQDRWFNWIRSSGQLLGAERVRRAVRETALAKAISLFHLCLKINVTTSRDSVKVLREFMVAMRIATPEGAPEAEAHPLDVLIDFAVNWQMPFWFDVCLLKAGSVTGVLIRPGFYDVFWEEAVEKFIARPDSRATDVGEKPPTGGSGSFFMDSAILAKLRKVAHDMPRFQPEAIRISEIGSITPNVRVEQWLQFLNKHLAPTFSVTAEDQILLTDRALLVTVNEFFQRYDKKDILAHIARLVNRTFSNIIKTTADMYIYDEYYSLSPLANASYACEIQVEDTYKLPIALKHITAKQLNHHRDNIDSLIGGVRSATISLLNASRWMSAESKAMAIKRVQETTVHLWPREDLTNTGELKKLHEKLPSGGKIYFDALLQVRKTMRGALGTPGNADLMWMPHGGRHPYFTYNPFNKSFSLAVGAIMPPLFYISATKSINYGGLGSLFAALVMDSLNVSSVEPNAAGWTVTRRDVGRPPCHASVSGSYSYVAAVEVVHKAYKDSLSRDGQSEDVRVYSLGDLTGEQVFFMSLCSSTCQLSNDLKTSEACNRALRNFEPFAAAFKCPKGSAMNTDAKCSFFV
ncbi:hypothetical protein HPB48_006883 [Haemaphysalis longicornis]|uniref:Peptidase M13 C-terminal domain-containing protein n=1 Tax=Haemaphysalis longicornis TaxID=44386 RepID=A0A9J6FG13_HAELO|nr:hypothetical protein HPB48_006883 [Haemaphysalis longicornis]